MVKLKLARYGAKKRPFYRIVAQDSRGKRDGGFLEILGTYNPLTEPTQVNIKMDRVKHWLSLGAKPTDAVSALLKNQPKE